MAEPFLAEIRLMSFNFAPKGWAACNGQTMQVSQSQALFSLIGNTFGGDGVTSFLLPNLQTGAPIGQGAGYTIGQAGGEQSHTLAIGEMPSHQHTAMGSPATPDLNAPPNNYLASYDSLYGPPNSVTNMASGELSTVGGQPHQNMQPYLTINFCIALVGIYPPRN